MLESIWPPSSASTTPGESSHSGGGLFTFFEMMAENDPRAGTVTATERQLLNEVQPCVSGHREGVLLVVVVTAPADAPQRGDQEDHK
jgi:hypothetical protein